MPVPVTASVGFSLKAMVLLWQFGLVDTLSMVQFFINSGSQYGAIVVAAASGRYSDIGPRVLLEPVIGFGTSYQFIRAAQTAAERKARIATLAAFISTSAGSALTTDPSTNAAVGGTVALKIAYMRAILTRGGATHQITKLISSLKDFAIIVDSVKTPVVTPLLNPAQMQFHQNCNIITQNIFAEHTA